MNDKDFSFDAIDSGEYYFTVKGESQKKLNSKYNDMGFKFVNAIVYNPVQDLLKVECFYMFNVMYYKLEDTEIKEIIKTLYEKMAK